MYDASLGLILLSKSRTRPLQNAHSLSLVHGTIVAIAGCLAPCHSI